MRYVIGLAQCDAVLGDLQQNLAAHRRWIAQARERGVDLLVFPELSLTGYLLQDLVHEVSLRADDPVLLALAREAAPMGVCVGGIEESPLLAQYIAGFYLEDGRVVHVHRKVYLASYGVFDEARYVGSGARVTAFDTRRGRLGIAICEDCWHPSLVGLLLLDGAHLIVVQTASPVRDLREGELPRNAEIWMDTLRSYARLYGAYIAFCNRVGSEDGLLFWGRSTVFGPDGEVVTSGPLYDEQLVVGEIDDANVRQARLANPVLREERLELTIHELQRILGGGSGGEDAGSAGRDPAAAAGPESAASADSDPAAPRAGTP
jgi:NAD+ synthase (glutamine-hydrolysing)